ncbi:MAG: DMT family transporter [Patescibacteria group bacterium]|nr:DMT family transporter [Patescibacteria group bacterium]
MNLPILALIFASIIWGAAAPIFKWSIENIPIFPLVFVRFFIASIFLIPFLKSTRIELRDVGWIILLGLLGISGNVAFFFLGISLTSAINAGIIAGAGPVFTILGARLFLREKQSFNLLLGSVVGLLGVLLITLQSVWRYGLSKDLLGNSLLILSILSLVGYEIIVKKVQKRYDPVLLTYSMFLTGALTFIIPAYWQLSRRPEFLLQLDVRGLSGIIFGIFFSSLLAYFLWTWGLSKLTVSRVGMFLYADPIAAAAIAVPLLHEKISGADVLGTILIFAGIYIAEKRIHHYLAQIRIHRNDHLVIDLKI